MLFNSLPFLFAFLPLTLLVYWRVAVRRESWRLWWLTLASYAFYAAWNVRFLPLIVGSTLVDYLVGPRIYNARSLRTRRAWLSMSIVSNLGALAVFKYYNFAAGQLNIAGHWLALPDLLPVLNVTLPIGISFTAFESLSYTIDLYRGRIEPAKRFVSIAAFVAVFPRMIAGPIIRFANFAPQLARDPRRRDRLADLVAGMQFFVLGLAKKVLIADLLGESVDVFLASKQYPHLGLVGAWLVMLGYSYQLYFDFSGYSDMAVGLGRWLGLDLPQNFRSPYKAVSCADFWRRWHMTLSAWLRDYLYVPLGGSRGSRLATYRNIMVTMALGGLWHGANWVFVLWGVFHGVLLAGERAMTSVTMSRVVGLRSANAAARMVTFALVVVGWAIFRSENVAMAGSLIAAMFGLGGWGLSFLSTGTTPFVVLVGGAALVAHAAPDTWDISLPPALRTAFALGALAALCVLCLSKASPFLYFQF